MPQSKGLKIISKKAPANKRLGSRAPLPLRGQGSRQWPRALAPGCLPFAGPGPRAHPPRARAKVPCVSGLDAEQQSSGVSSLPPEVPTRRVRGWRFSWAGGCLGRPVCTPDCRVSVVQTPVFSEMPHQLGSPPGGVAVTSG